MSNPKYLDLIDTETTGQRYDVTPLFADGEALAALCADLLAPWNASDFDAIAGIDALGFVLGAAMASRAGVGFVAVRKGGKLPVVADTRTFVDYTGHQKSLELRPDAIKPGTRVLLVDEWIETGAQITAALSLLESQDAHVVGIAAICIDDNPITRALAARIECVSVGPLDNDAPF